MTATQQTYYTIDDCKELLRADLEREFDMLVTAKKFMKKHNISFEELQSV